MMCGLSSTILVAASASLLTLAYTITPTSRGDSR